MNKNNETIIVALIITILAVSFVFGVITLLTLGVCYCFGIAFSFRYVVGAFCMYYILSTIINLFKK